MLKRLKFLALGLALVLPLAACDDDGAPDLPPVPPALGNISGTALIEGSGLPNATIAIAGPQAGTAVTGANGSYSFTGIPVGAYTATISVGDPDITFAISTQSVTVTDGQTAIADFDGSFIRTAAIVGIVTVDTGDGAAGVALVPISVSGTESFPTQSTNTNGEFAFSGLRAGAYAVSADVSALDPGIIFASTLENVTVLTGATVAVAFFGQLPGEATVSIASVNTLLGAAVNPAAVLGTFTVTANHDAGDDTATRLSLLLNDVEVDFQTFSSTGVAGLEGPARTPGDPVTFAVNSAAFDPVTFLVAFANGEYAVSVQLTLASGKVVTATLGTPLTFANLDILTVRHTTGGKGVVSQGVRFWGAEDINFEAVVIIYTQAISIADIGVTALGIGASKSPNSTTLSLDLGSGHGAQNRATSAPFTFTAEFADNAIVGTNGTSVEDIFLGLPPQVQGQTLSITSVRDAAGIDILPDFQGQNTPLTGFLVDFVPPRVAVGGPTLIGVDGVDIPLANAATTLPEWYSAGEDYELVPGSSITELGVGGKNTIFDIDDQGTAQPADPDFTFIGGPGNLPENDNGPGTGFVAELVSLMDNLGNATNLTANPVDGVGHAFGDNHSDEHGTDFGAPVTSKIFPDPAVTIILNPDDEFGDGGNDINWDTDENTLADLSLGSGMYSRTETNLTIVDPAGIKADVTCHALTPSVVVAAGLGAATIDYSVDLTAGGAGCFASVGGVGPLDGLWEFDIDIPDLALEANETPIAWNIIIDGTDPFTNLSDAPGSAFGPSANNTLTFSISGDSFDLNGLSEVLARVREDANNNGCSLDDADMDGLIDDPLLVVGAGPGQINQNSVNVTAQAALPGFTVTFVINNNSGGAAPPSAAPTNPQRICWFIESADNAKDNAGDLEPNLSDASILSIITWS